MDNVPEYIVPEPPRGSPEENSATVTGGILRTPSASNLSTRLPASGQARPKLNPEKETKGKQCRHSAHLNSVTVRAYVHDLLFVEVHRLRPPLPRRCGAGSPSE